MFAHVPKINAGMACLVLLCFFLPWVSFSCGTITFLKVSGYHLTAGKLPVDESAVKQYEQRAGRLADDDRVPSEVRTPAPKFIYLIVIICALNIIGFSLKMMDGEIDKFKSIAVMAFAGIGFVFMIVGAILDFGIEIPSGSEMLIQSSFEIGYFGTLFGCSACIGLSLFSLKVLSQSRVFTAPGELQIPEEVLSGSEGIGGTESFSKEIAEHFGVAPKKQPEIQAPAPAGAKMCPGCNAVVGLYQVKCLKCGTALKPGNNRLRE